MPFGTSYQFVNLDDNDTLPIKHPVIDFGPATGGADVVGLANGTLAGIGNASASTLGGVIFSATGNVKNSFGPDNGTNGSIAQLSDGNLVTSSEFESGIVVKITNSVTGAEVVATTGISSPDSSNVDVAALGGGGFVVVYQRNFGGTDNDIIVTIGTNGGAISTPFSLDVATANDTDPSVAQLDGGNIVIAWTRTVGSQTEIWYAIRDAGGGLVKDATLFDTNSALNQNVSVAALNGGGFAFAYEDNEHKTGNTDITLATFDADGNNSVKHNVGDNFPNTDPSLIRLSNGLLAMAYSQAHGGGDDDTFVALINPTTGRVLATRDIITTEIAADNENAVVAEFGGGHLIVADNDVTSGDVRGEDLLIMRTSNGSPFSSNTFAGDNFIDVVTGGNFSDKLSGGGGNDSIIGLGGTDSLSGGAGDDLLEGEAGVDTINGGDGSDRIFGMTEAAPSGSVFSDFLNGGRGADQITGANGFNTLNGDEGNDTVTGGSSQDTISGGLAADIMNGNEGGDVLTGGRGTDRMTGGSGNDLFDFNRIAESRAGALRDVITDFTSASVDHIDVSDIDAQASAAGDQDFSFIGTNAFTAEGQIRAVQSGADTIVHFNTRGAAHAEMQIYLLNFTATDLSSADFIT